MTNALIRADSVNMEVLQRGESSTELENAKWRRCWWEKLKIFDNKWSLKLKLI